MTTRRHKLSVSFDEDYCLLGIVSDEPDYRMGWLLNRDLGFSFVKTEDAKVYNSKLNEDQFVSSFLYHDETTMMSYRLISNRCSTGYFLSDMKHIDYLLFIQGEPESSQVSLLMKKMQAIASIRMCVPANLSKIRELDRLQIW